MGKRFATMMSRLCLLLLLGSTQRPTVANAFSSPTMPQLSDNVVKKDGPSIDDIKEVFPDAVEANELAAFSSLSSARLSSNNVLPNHQKEQEEVAPFEKEGRHPLNNIEVYANVVDAYELVKIFHSIDEAILHEVNNFPQWLQTQVQVDPSTLAKLRGYTGRFPLDGQEKEVPVMIVHGESSKSHIDYKDVDLYTAMLVVDTEGDAYFHHGDDFSIPLVRGMLLHFRGNISHHTEIEEGGRVTYLGDLNWFLNWISPVETRNLMMYDSSGSDARVIPKGVGYVRKFGVPSLGCRWLADGYETAVEEAVVSGTVTMGHLVHTETNAIEDNFLHVDVSGLPSSCAACPMKVAILADSDECTKEAHDKAMFIPLQDSLTYSTDDSGTTDSSVYEAFSEAEDADTSAHPLIPTLAQLLGDSDIASLAITILEAFTNYTVVVYLYDHDETPVACSHLHPLSDEEATKYDALFNGLVPPAVAEGNDTDTSSSSSTAPESEGEPEGNENPSLGSNTLLSAFAIAACMLVGAFLFVSV